MPIIKMDLPEGWQLLESKQDTKGRRTYRLMDIRRSTPLALAEYEDKPDEKTLRRAIQNYLEWK